MERSEGILDLITVIILDTKSFANSPGFCNADINGK